MIAIAIKEETGIERCDEAVRCGVPFARGEAGEMDVWELLDESGHPVVSAVRAAAYWDDGSIKWLLVDFAATAAAGAEVVFRLRRIGESESAAAEDKPALSVQDALPEKLVVSTGAMVVTFLRDGPIEVHSSAGDWELDSLGANLTEAEGGRGIAWAISPPGVDCRLEYCSSRRVVVRLQGDLFLPSGEMLGRVICRVHCLSGADSIVLDHTYINGVDIRKRLFCDAGLIIRVVEQGDAPSAGEVRFGIDGTVRSEAVDLPETGYRLFQTNADRPRPPAFNQFAPRVLRSSGYDSSGPVGETIGDRLDGWAAWRQGDCQLTVAVEELWQQYPKEIVLGPATAIKLFTRDEVEPGELDIDWRVGIREEDISPTGAPWRRWGDDGVAKTHRVRVSLHHTDRATVHEEKARAFQSPLLPGVSPERYAQTGAMGTLAPARPQAFPRSEQFLQGLTEWLWRHQREWSNWYGMVNWGGIQTHYLPLEGHWTNLVERFGWLNGETEPQLGVLLQYVRTGDTRWLRMGTGMVKHLVDVDAVHLGERAGYMRRHFAVHFGQPGDMSHTFLGAPCLLYFLTGEERVREAIQQVADLSMSYFSEGYERDSTDAMKNCLWYYELSGDERYREHAEKILESSLKNIAADGGVGIPHDTGFHTNFYLLSALLLYDRMLGPEKISEGLLRIMDYEIGPRGRDDDPGVSRGASYEGLAYAYLQTRDRRYLYPGIKDLGASISFSNVYQIFTPNVRFPSGNTTYYRPFEGDLRPDSYSSMHWLGRFLTMVPHFLTALHTAGIREDDLPVDGGICGSQSPFVRDLPSAPPPPNVRKHLSWDAPNRDYPGGDARTGFPLIWRGRSAFTTLNMNSVWNSPPLTSDPFGYDAAAIAAPQLLEAVEHTVMGSVQDNLIGLPWGTEAILGGIPFRLGVCTSADDPGMLVLQDGETYTIPVGMRLGRLHILGNVAGSGDMQMGTVGAIYRIVYANGEQEEIPLRNLVHYEDWRYLHYAKETPLAYAWHPKAFSLVPVDAGRLAASDKPFLQRHVVPGNAEPGKENPQEPPRHIETPFGTHPLISVPTGPYAGDYYWFAHRLQKSRHLNQFVIDAQGREVAEIQLQDTGAGHRVFLLAVTAETPDTEGPASRAARVSFPGGRPMQTSVAENLPLEVEGWKRRPEEQPEAAGAIFPGSSGLRLRTAPGRWYLRVTLSGGPVMVNISANGRRVVSGLHLLGNWCRDWPDPVQRIGFEVETPDGEIELEFEVDPALLYDRTLSHPGGHGWVWREESRVWERRVPEPWQLLSVEAEAAP